MTTPTIVNFSVTRDDDFSAVVTFDQLVAGFSEMRFTVRETWASTESDNTDAIYTTTLTATGAYTASLEIPNAETATWTQDRLFHDISVVTAIGAKQFTTQRGEIRVGPDVGRS